MDTNGIWSIDPSLLGNGNLNNRFLTNNTRSIEDAELADYIRITNHYDPNIISQLLNGQGFTFSDEDRQRFNELFSKYGYGNGQQTGDNLSPENQENLDLWDWDLYIESRIHWIEEIMAEEAGEKRIEVNEWPEEIGEEVSKKQGKKRNTSRTIPPNFKDKKMKERMKGYYQKKKAILESLKDKGKSFSQIDNETARELYQMLKRKGYPNAIAKDAFIFWSQITINSYNGSGNENIDSCLIGWCWLSQEQIIEMTGINKNNLAKIKEALVNEGLLIIEKRLFKGAPKDYYLPFPKIDQS